MPRRRAPSATGRPAAASSSRARSAAGVSRSASRAARTAARPAGPVAVGRTAPQRQPGRGGGHVLVGAPVPVLPVVVRQEGEPHGGGVPLLAEVAHEDEVAERLRHLGAVQAHQADVEPQPDELLPGDRLGLRRLALVMGEHEVAAAAVDVDRLAELTQDEGRALDVPPGPSRPPARLPRRLVGQRRLPQHEVERVTLVGVLGVPAVLGGQLEHVGPVVAADPAELGEGRHAEVDRTAGLVRKAPLERVADQREDLRDGGRRPRLGVHGQEVEQSHLGVETRHLLGRQVQVVHTELAGLAQDVVVDVGDVAHALRLVPGILQAALEHVEVEVHGGMSEVRGVIRRDAARVHRHERAGLEGHHLPARRVVQPHS